MREDAKLMDIFKNVEGLHCLCRLLTRAFGPSSFLRAWDRLCNILHLLSHRRSCLPYQWKTNKSPKCFHKDNQILQEIKRNLQSLFVGLIFVFLFIFFEFCFLFFFSFFIFLIFSFFLSDFFCFLPEEYHIILHQWVLDLVTVPQAFWISNLVHVCVGIYHV